MEVCMIDNFEALGVGEGGILALSQLATYIQIHPPSSKVAKLGFWSKKMHNVLKPMKNNFPIFIS